MKEPKIDIRNLRRVESKKHFGGYSYTFEALRWGKWVAYGPNVYGNWICKTGVDCLPRASCERLPGYNDTLDIGFTSLDKIYKAGICKPKDEEND